MRIVVAPQALKGSLDALHVGEAIAAGVRAVLPGAELEIIPVADGGEGTVRALVAATEGELRFTHVTGPLGELVEAEWGLLGPAGEPVGPGRPKALSGGSKTAVIEMAAASGLPLVSPDRRDPLVATTRGTGELIRAALDEGCDRLLIGIGGSATNDGGAGMAQALGARLLDADSHDLPPGGEALARLDRIDMTAFDPRIQGVNIQVVCDVTNPLAGPNGASAVYGPQKGATPAMVAELDAALRHYAERLKWELGQEVDEVPGAGAAGGLGAGLLAFCHAQLVPGAQMVFEALHFVERLAGVQLVFTAEGRLDGSTGYGKAPAAVAAAARQVGARVICFAGSVALDPQELQRLGIDVAVPIVDGPTKLEDAMARAAELVERAAERALRLIVIGQALET
jgi:glycerate kinase